MLVVNTANIDSFLVFDCQIWRGKRKRRDIARPFNCRTTGFSWRRQKKLDSVIRR